MEHLLGALVADSNTAPARVCSLLNQRNITITSIQLSKLPDTPHWWLQLAVCLDDCRAVEQVVKWLNRLIDVVKVIDVASKPNHQRQSVFVKLRPAASDVVHVNVVASLFGAEILDITRSTITLHLSDSPKRCEQFHAMLRPYNVAEALPGAVSGTWASCVAHEQ